jgi:glycosyltransferase involved in cell wall biosynthesis
MENKTPVLSICIPTYNSSKFLSETLDSIVPQFDNKEFFDKTEIIISDNDSPDNTFDIVKKYQKKYNNIKYFKNHTNLG